MPVVAVVSVYYLFLASAGTFRDLPTQLAYYDLMSEGFRQGNLYIQIPPSARLLAQADPFKYENRPLWLWDASLYEGRYYLYWGPVPALFILAFKTLTGTYERISDQWPTAIFMIGRLWAGAALILGLASRVRVRQPALVCCLAIAVFGLAHPTPFVVARPHVYEAALAGGQCFLLWGLVFVFWGIEQAARRWFLFTLTGIAWALAIGCRVTSFLCVPVLLLIAAGFAWYRSSRSLKTLVPECLAMGVPVAAAGVAYGWYNYARFDSVWEFGVSHQLTTQPFWGNDAYVWPNIYSYLFGPVSWSWCHFPFARILGHRPLSPLLTWPPGYKSFELVGGIMLTATWCWFVLLAVLQLAAYLGTRRRRLAPTTAVSDLSAHETWLLLSSLGLMIGMVPVLSLWEASMRYVEDALGGILLIGVVGVFWLLRLSYRARGLRFATRGLVALVALQTCLVGAFAGFSNYDDSFRTVNPPLYAKLEKALSLCPAPVSDWP